MCGLLFEYDVRLSVKLHFTKSLSTNRFFRYFISHALEKFRIYSIIGERWKYGRKTGKFLQQITEQQSIFNYTYDFRAGFRADFRSFADSQHSDNERHGGNIFRSF